MTVVVTQNNITSPNADVTALTVGTANGLNFPDAGPLSNRNLIINGSMQVAQRGTSAASITTLGYYTVDRFQTMLNTLGTWTVSRETDAPNTGEFKYSLKHTCTTADASPAASDYAIIYQRFETQNVRHFGYGSASAKNVTLSFWVKSNKTGNASTGIFFSNSGTNRYISKQYTINAANTWEYKTITFSPNTTLSMDSSDTDAGFFVEWWMNSGSNFSGGSHDTWSTSQTVRNPSNLGVGGATSDYFSLTGVQLEVGTVATPFEHRSYGEELALCQRYYYTIADGNSRPIASVGAFSTSAVYGIIHFPVTMRAAPAADTVTGTGYYYITGNGGNDGFNTVVMDNFSTTGCRIGATANITTVTGYFYQMLTQNSLAYVAVTAEL